MMSVMTNAAVIAQLKRQRNHKNIAGMARFGINPSNTLGIPIPALRKMAKEIGKDHELSQGLWQSGIHEARILAAFVDDPQKVTPAQMDAWIKDFDSWDVCDQVCANLFDKTPHAFAKALQWAKHEPEFERRAGFALMAALAWHNKTAPDQQFEPFFAAIKKYATDERNYVKKAVNWALRQIGKHSPALRAKAIAAAEEILKLDSKPAKWIAADALKELNGYS